MHDSPSFVRDGYTNDFDDAERAVDDGAESASDAETDAANDVA